MDFSGKGKLRLTEDDGKPAEPIISDKTSQSSIKDLKDGKDKPVVLS
jgi:hypothetical protein